jgi:AraC-like DNA-binding protein
MTRRQELLEDMQDPPLPALVLAPEVRGLRFHPGFAMPLSVRRFSGAMRLSPSEGSMAILYLCSGTASAEGGGTRLPAPALASIAGPWTSSEEASGWLASFHPRIINQEFADWPSLCAGIEADPMLTRDRELLEAVIGGPSPGAAPRPLLLDPEEASFLSRLFSGMTDLLESQYDIYWPCRGRSFFLEILFFLWRRPSPEGLAGAESLARRVHDWLRVHYAEKVSIARLAELFGSNRTTLQERFKQEYGASVMDHLGEIRAEAASILMRNTELTLAEIGARVGFAEYSNFYREFSRRRALSPSSYRKAVATVRIY